MPQIKTKKRVAWNKGKKMSPLSASHKEKIRQAHLKSGLIPPNWKGKKRSPESVEKSASKRRGQKRPNQENSKSWKGEDASYAAKHIWARFWLKDPKRCECCGTTKNLQWSNKDHKHQRIITDWKRLCAKCHRQYDDFTFGKRVPWNKKSINGLE